MKELLEFYNKSPENVKTFIIQKCYYYFNPEEPDGYRKSPTTNYDLFDILSSSSDKDLTFDYEVHKKAAILSRCSYEEVKELLFKEHKAFHYRPERMDICNQQNSILLLHLTSDDLRKHQSERLRDRDEWKEPYQPEYVFLLNKDFSQEFFNNLFNKITEEENTRGWGFGLLDNLGYDINVWIDLFGLDNIRKYLQRSINNLPNSFIYNTKDKRYLDLFDELFFCDNSWLQDDKIHFVEDTNISTISRFEQFVEKFLCVDMSYVKCLPHIFRYDLPMLNALASLKKPEDELTEGMSYREQYRFGEKFRMLLKACYACMTKKEIGKAREKNLKEIAPLLKFYNKDFDMIVDAMYPEAVAE